MFNKKESKLQTESATGELQPLPAAATPTPMGRSLESRRTNVRNLVLMALFVAIIVVLALTPLGIIAVGPIGATTIHIPVIIGALVLGVKYGASLGFCFGLTSMLVATFMPFIGAFAFSPFIPVPSTGKGSLYALLICFVPRILLGVFTSLSFKLFHRVSKHPSLAYGWAALVGTLTNTILVLGGIYLFFAQDYSSANGLAMNALLGALLLTVVTQGIPEAILAFLVAAGVGKVIESQKKRDEHIVNNATHPIAERNNELLSQLEQMNGELESLKRENERLKDLVGVNTDAALELAQPAAESAAQSESDPAIATAFDAQQANNKEN